MKTFRFPHLLAMALLLLIGLEPLAAATISDDGDAYPGTIGSGWTSTWSTKLAGTYTVTADTSTSSPLSGGGSYITFASSPNGGTAGTINRSFDSTSSGVDATKAYTISFNYRPDVTPSSVGAETYTIFSAGVASASTFSNDYWQIAGSNGGWYVYSGNGSGGVTQTATGISVVAGTTYQFTINVDPTTRTWSLFLSDGTNSFTSLSQNFRITSANYVVPSNTFLEFGTSVGTSTRDLGFSVDSIVVSSVPEPTVTALAGIGLLVLGCGWYQRRN